MKPVLLITYKRPEFLERQLAILREAGVKDVYIFQDGHPEVSIEDPKIVKVNDNWSKLRQMLDYADIDFSLIKEFDSIKFNSSITNLGCKMGVYTAMKWFFENVDSGIILEDDAMPHPDFFKFASDMLDYYASDSRIFTINGCNFNKTSVSHNGYYLSKLTHSWGFATWKRVFDRFDINMEKYLGAGNINRYLFNGLLNVKFNYKWTKRFLKTMFGSTNTWDYQWQYNLWLYNGLAVTPDKNLISNIGYGEDAVHTKKETKFANMPTESLDWVRTAGLVWHQVADGLEIENCF